MKVINCSTCNSFSMWKGLFSVVLLSLAVRMFVGLGSHSGKGFPPLFGDFEAQRHWMELTVALPSSQWYSYDLKYWGLDYPPLTALHSYAIGLVGTKVVPESFEFETSRGKEDNSTRQFMRMSVIASDLLSYIPAMSIYALSTERDWRSLLLWALLQPALLLIDHGHFQFNGVALGLVALAVALIHTKHELLASAMFVFALNFKHMALYFAPSFFFVLLGRNWVTRDLFGTIWRIGLIGLAVIASFALVWAPFLANGTAMNVLTRMFPVARGIFEDKVANLWCTAGPIFRFKERFSAEQLFRFAAAATLSAMAPSCAMLFRRPTTRMFLLSLANVSLAFFLLAFQVHEKNILMPLLPLSMLWSSHRHLVTSTTAIACFSMFPLLERDGLALQYAFFMPLLAWACFRWRSSWILLISTWIPVLCTHLLMIFVAPPKNLPHLWIMLCMVISFLHFVSVFLMTLWFQFHEMRKEKFE